MQSKAEKSESHEPQAGWVFHPGDIQADQLTEPVTANKPVPPSEPSVSNGHSITWTASEYIAHQKGVGWVMGLIAATVFIAGLVFLLTRDYVSSAMIIIISIIFSVFALRQPRVLEYGLDEQGVTIGRKRYAYELFKSFSVLEEGIISSLQLMPLKRFMPTISIFYAKEDEEKILKSLADYLPYEEPRRDLVDQFMRKIRF